MKKNIGINAVLNTTKTLMSMIFPLITYPYALRVLGVTNIGKVSYVASIVSYFTLFAMLGVNSYAVREGSRLRDNSEKLTKFSNEVFSINLLFTLISSSFLILSAFVIPNFSGYRILFLIQCFTIFFTALSIEWINTIYEDYLFITLRSLIIQILSLVLLFLFVKKESDFYVYSAIQVITNGFVCVSNWVNLRKYIKLRVTLNFQFFKHIKPLLILFSNSIAVSIYVNFDTTMIGWIRGDYDVGLYTASTKIYHIMKSLMMAIYTVFLPRLSYYAGFDDNKAYKALYSKLWSYVSLILLPAAIGLFSVSKEVILLLGGENYLDSAPVLKILSFSLIFAIFSGLVTTCLNVVHKREKENLIATLLSASVNCSLNFIAIPLWGPIGAAITTLISELFVLIFTLFRIKNKEQYIDFMFVGRNLKDAFIGCILIVILSCLIHYRIDNIFLALILTVVGSVAFYFGFMFITKNEICIGFFKNIIKKLHK